MRCLHCGQDLSSRASRCSGCGEEVRQEVRQAAAVHEGERRHATVLFSDLTGYTQLNESVDPEDVEAVLTELRAMTNRVVERHGGTVNQFVGDGAMVVFGVPVARRGDALRAVLAALDLHREIRRIDERWRTRIGQPLLLHSGVETGTVVVREGAGHGGRYALIGDAVNTAARLSALAGGDDILVGPQAWGQVQFRIHADAPDSVQLRGKSGPLVVHRVIATREEAASAPWVGRPGELSRLLEAGAGCVDSGRAASWVICGEAGIGKTRLMQEAAARLRARGFDTSTLRFTDFGEANGRGDVRAFLRSLRAKLASRLGGVADEGPPVLPDVPGDLLPFLDDLAGEPLTQRDAALMRAMDVPTRERTSMRAMAWLLGAAADVQPLLVQIDDVQWADSSTVKWWAGVIAECTEHPILFVATSRLEGDPSGDPEWLAALDPIAVQRIDLGPLDGVAALTLAREHHAEDGDDSASWVARCVSRASGHPLYLEQLLLAGPSLLADGALPGSIQALVLARLDQLSPPARSLIQAASVLGQQSSPAALAHLLPDAVIDLAPLRAAGLVREAGGQLEFAHGLIREGAYEALLKSRRRELHARAADWYSGKDGTLRAEHLDRAGSPLAADAYLEAARERAAALRFDDAQALVRRSLALPPWPRRFESLILLGQILLDGGHGEAARAPFEEVLSAEAGDEQRCRALIGLATVHRHTDEIGAALAALQRAEALATAGGLARECSRLHHLRGNLYFPLGRAVDCEAEHRLALDWARRAGSPVDEVAALGGLGDACYLQGLLRSALGHFERCVALSREHGLGRTEVANLPMVAVCLQFLGEVDRGLVASREALDLTTRSGMRRARLVALHALALQRGWYTNEFDAALVDAEAALAGAREIGARRFEAEGLGLLAHVQWRRGQYELARSLARDGLMLCRTIEAMTYMGPFLLAEVALTTDDADERQAVLGEGEQWLARGSAYHNYFWFYDTAIELALDERRGDEAQRLADALAHYAQRERPGATDLVIRRARAIASFIGGDHGDALRVELRSIRQAALDQPFLPLLPSLDRALAGLGPSSG